MKQLFGLAAAGFMAMTAHTMAADVEAGQKVFRKCQACHAVGADAKNKVGPILNGVVGRGWGAVEGYKYSKNLIELADGRVWDEESLHIYLTKPKDLIPKGKMAFAGLRKEQDRINVIAYMAQFKEDGSTE